MGVTCSERVDRVHTIELDHRGRDPLVATRPVVNAVRSNRWRIDRNGYIRRRFFARRMSIGVGPVVIAREPSQKVLLVRNLYVDSFREIDVSVQGES
jgi:hypothetical protein